MAKIRSFLFPCPRQRDATAIVFSLFGICCGWVPAAAPEVSSLFPSGGQRGTTTSVQLHAPGAAPDRIWCSQAKLKAALSTEPGRMTVTIPSNADFGVYELRFINQEGVSALRRFVVGALPEINETEPNDLWNKPQKNSISVNCCQRSAPKHWRCRLVFSNAAAWANRRRSADGKSHSWRFAGCRIANSRARGLHHRTE